MARLDELFGQEINGSLLLFLAVVTLIGLYYLVNKYQKRMYPPSYGWIPYIGCAVEFGKSPLHFINWATQKYGSIFTLNMTGKRFTFLTDPEDFKIFFQSPNLDFQQAVQQPVQKTGSISKASFWNYHTELHDTIKHKLAPGLLDPFCRNLSQKFQKEIRAWLQKGEAELNCLTRSSMYKGVLDNLFGENVLPTSDERQFAELEKHFVKFDEDFEYGSQLPDIFLKEWKKSKKWLLDLFKKTLSENSRKDSSRLTEYQTVFESVTQRVDKEHAPNYSMLMMWASLANAVPITFWSLAFIFSKPDVLAQLKKEVNEVIGDQDFDNLEISEDTLSRMPGIKRAVMEAIRIRAPGTITRGVKQTFRIRDFIIPKGDMVMLSPYWAHRNTKYFPDPETFNPDRWLAADLSKNIFLEGFVAFGGGRFQCPGRWFALLEIHLFVALVVYYVDLTLIDPLPTNSPLHLVGVQQPEGPCRVKITSAKFDLMANGEYFPKNNQLQLKTKL